jgi:hypothetical protein
MAAADEAKSYKEAEALLLTPLVSQVAKLLTERTLNPWCGLCAATADQWKYEVGRSRFRTMEEAEPMLRQVEGEQIITNALWGDMPRSD